MDIYDRDDSLFYNQENPDVQRELQWHDNVFGERIGPDAEEADDSAQQSDQDAPPIS
ncbi:MAG TPA: hypothetical protein VK963_04755 [Candidatus Saccharimonadales bacterium]|nr:hypothetical protein [Candidatus Saccharimonadales bacterium]